MKFDYASLENAAVQRVRQYAVERGDDPDAEAKGFLKARQRMTKRIRKYLRKHAA